MKPVVIIGVGPEAQLAAELLTLQNHMVYGFLAIEKVPDEPEFYDIPVLGTLSNKDLLTVFKAPDQEYVIALSNPELRKATLAQLFKLTGRLPFNAVHPTASISNYAKLATGNLIGSQTVISPGVSVGVLNVLSAAVVLELDAVIGDFCTIGAGVLVGQGAKIEDKTFLGPGCIIGAGVTVGTQSVIGAGTVVQKDLPPETKAIIQTNLKIIDQT